MVNELITRIELTGEFPKIRYERDRGQNRSEVCEFPSKNSYSIEHPRSELYDSVNYLVSTVIKVCGLDEDIWADATITDVFLSHFSSNQMGVGPVVAKVIYNDLPLQVRMPRLPSDRVDATLQVALVDICREAQIYLSQRSSQLNLLEAKVG